jgi:uncharacterized membrane protein YdbT with pleckstrin-like domain
MGYVDRILEPGEAVRYRTTISWTAYGPGLWVALAALIAAYLAVKLFVGWLFLLTGALALIALFAVARAYFVRWTTEIAVTDRRIIFKRGFIRRHTVEMNMQKVESVDVDQTLFGRLFDYGDVTVRGVGRTFERLSFIDAPLRFRTTVTAG